jgi:pimeloyl-ACP methyl ester carboxylesterase
MTLRINVSLFNPGLKSLLAIGLLSAVSACSQETSTPAESAPMQEPAVAAPASTPMLSPAVGTSLLNCEELSAQFAFNQTVLTDVALVPAGDLEGYRVGEHCLISGQMNQRISEVDGNAYAVGFEMRLPSDWNGRFFYQANGGIDGRVATSIGGMLGGGPLSTALSEGFAVINSDAGHQGPTPFFGIDPQARLDYGYTAVGTLTPMAKALISSAYGKGPDRSYFAGCSNGGRHAMIAAARYADEYDGILAGNPGFNLPQAAVAQLYAAQQFTLVSTSLNENGEPDISTAFTQMERDLIAASVLEQCDGLDGAVDGMVANGMACQAAFELERDVPTCTGERDGSCLSDDQKTVLENIMSGARNSAGDLLYSSFPYDAGTNNSNWAFWKYGASQSLDPGSVGFIFSTPPFDFNEFVSQSGLQFALNFEGIYSEAAMSFMTPPNPTDLSDLRDRGAKMMVFHGTSDGIFSSDDTARWYSELNEENNGDADAFTRLYLVPGMNHCGGGPSTDQFDMVTALVNWVEQGEAPDRILASARGEGNPISVNEELPADWAPDRTRPLCPYPQIARYNGNGDIEDAANFSCEAP